jgi:hypothetical protein
MIAFVRFARSWNPRALGLFAFLLLSGCETESTNIHKISMEACKQKGGIPHYHSNADGGYPSVTCEFLPDCADQKGRSGAEKEPQVPSSHPASKK